MKVIEVTKEYFKTEDGQVYYFINGPLENEISIYAMQDIVNANEKLMLKAKDKGYASRTCGYKLQ